MPPSPANLSRWELSARLRARDMHPAASHTAERLTTRSRPARLATNSGERCSAHSHTLAPNGRCRRALGPAPGPTQIAQGGSFPIPLAL